MEDPSIGREGSYVDSMLTENEETRKKGGVECLL
jgi:hypothetical protein